jgi:hypothetical protein
MMSEPNPTTLALLSTDERRDLERDLAEMARLRRKAEAESAHIVIGSGL